MYLRTCDVTSFTLSTRPGTFNLAYVRMATCFVFIVFEPTVGGSLLIQATSAVRAQTVPTTRRQLQSGKKCADIKVNGVVDIEDLLL